MSVNAEIIERLDRIEKTVNNKDLIIGLQGLANYLGVSIGTAKNLKKDGIIPYSHLGRACIFLKSDVIDILKKHPNYHES